jgi:hypothetical protein
MHFFANEFARLSGGCLSFTFALSGSLDGLFLRHKNLLMASLEDEL